SNLLKRRGRSLRWCFLGIVDVIKRKDNICLCLIFFQIVLLASCNKTTIHPHIGEIVEAAYGLGTVESEDIYRAKSGVVVSIVEFYVKEGQDKTANY
ncbi:MAG: hypothetical protein WCJ33_10310, partial [Pseudomonadota bacterium]